MSRRRIRAGAAVASVLILSGFAWVGLRPFDPTPQNRVRQTEDGLRFDRGVALGRTAAFPTSGSGCTIEVWMRPDRNRDSSVLLDFYDPDGERRLGIEQRGDREIRFTRRDRSGVRGLRAAHRFMPEESTLVTATLDARGARLYVDGVAVAESVAFPRVPGDCEGTFTLGTGAASDSTWRGVFVGLAIYDRGFGPGEAQQSYRAWLGGESPRSEWPDSVRSLYLFDRGGGPSLSDRADGGSLRIPASFGLPVNRFLYAPTWGEVRVDGLDWPDVLVNILGFAPLGFALYPLFALWGRGKGAARATLGCGLLTSLLLETLQHWLPTRTSSLLDVLTNVMGTGLGVVLSAAGLALLASTARISAD